jgi:GT2 family glycosyltransferase
LSRRPGVVVPNYNGADLLPRYLPGVLRSLERAGGGEAVVVDDASSDGSVALLRERFPDVRLIVRSANGGFGEAVNQGVRELDADLVAVCMTDMELHPDALSEACRMFDRDDVFAVAFRLMENEGAGSGGVTSLVFSRGMFHTVFPDAERPGLWGDLPVNVAFATGGAMVVRRDLFLSLGGFDPAYAPFNWEDVDLCWRAWRRRWRSVHCPDARAWHRHPHLTVQRSSSGETVRRILWRNRILFVRKNIRDPSTLLRHRFWLTLIKAKAFARRDGTVAQAEREAARLLRRTCRPREMGPVSDRALMEYLSRPRRSEEALP